MRLLLTLAMLTSVCGIADAAEKYHLVSASTTSPNKANLAHLVCVERGVAQKILVKGSYNSPEGWVLQESTARMAAEMLPFQQAYAIISADCLEEFVSVFKEFNPDQKLVVVDIEH